MFSFERFTESVSSAVTACDWGTNRLDAFWRTSSGQLGHKWFDGSWHDETLPVNMRSDPAACSWGPNRIDLFWRDGASTLRHKHYDGGWGPEESFAESIASRPAACCWASGRIDVFWRDSSSRLRHKWYDRRWSASETLASGVESGPAACSWSPGRIDVFYRGSNGKLMQVWYQDRWQGPADLGGSFVGEPAACSWAPGVVDVFVRRPDNTIWHRWFDGGWHDWLQRPEGMTAATLAVTSWADGRIDMFVPGMDGRLYHGWYAGQPVATRNNELKTLWGFLSDYSGADKIQRLLNSFSCGTLNRGGCSGAMISPHIFLTASHCGGPGWTGTVSFYRIDQFASPPDERAQQLSPAYRARTFPWQDSGIGSSRVRGDTVLWWVPDGADGIPPGIKYGYLEMSELPVEIGTRAYSFWQNPAIRMDTTLLYSEGVAQSKGNDTGWLGQWTNYTTWSVGGASGSSNLVADGGHAHRVVGVTQGGSGGPGRMVADGEEFVREYDTDNNRVIDAVDYDWLFTSPILDFHLLTFDSPFRLSRWTAVPNGSATSPGEHGDLTGRPRMNGRANMTDGYWHIYARFRPNQTYCFSVAALGTQDGSTANQVSYVKLRSEETGHEVRFTFQPRAQAARFLGRVRLSGASDYRLILGTDAGTTLEVQSLAVIAEGRPVGFSTHDERRSWEYAGASRPTSWGTEGPRTFAGAVVGPTSSGWGLRNRNLGLLENTQYRIRFETLGVKGAAAARACYVRMQDLAGNVAAQHQWDFSTSVGRQTHEFTGNSGSGVKTLVFGANLDLTYLVGDLHIDRV